MKNIIYLLFAMIFLSFVSRSDFKIFRWKIDDWKQSFFIDIPTKNYKMWMMWSGAAKSIGFFYQDSSSIHIMVDPPSFDSLNRNFLYVNHALKIEAQLVLRIKPELTDTLRRGDTIIYQGVTSNGRLWKEISFKRTKICYVNIDNGKKEIYDKSINSFREQRRKYYRVRTK